MILIVIRRVAHCEVCHAEADLAPGDIDGPETCFFCGSKDWRYGVESRDSRFIRQQITKNSKILNPGAKSLKRQERGKKQFRAFKPQVDQPQQSS